MCCHRSEGSVCDDNGRILRILPINNNINNYQQTQYNHGTCGENKNECSDSPSEIAGDIYSVNWISMSVLLSNVFIYQKLYRNELIFILECKTCYLVIL
jgi:hypothetical protein